MKFRNTPRLIGYDLLSNRSRQIAPCVTKQGHKNDRPKISRVRPDEVTAGLVLNLDPDVLARYGWTVSCSDDRRVIGRHFFLCLDVRGEVSDWVPMFSRDGAGRRKVAQTGRTGHPKWIDGCCYYHTRQVWTAADRQAVIEAALAGRDLTNPDQRNRLALSGLPSLFATAG